MDAMDVALGSLQMASSGQMMQYSTRVLKKAMDAEAQSAANLLNMLPQQQSFQVRGPQPGDVPAISKGSFFDIYA